MKHAFAFVNVMMRLFAKVLELASENQYRGLANALRLMLHLIKSSIPECEGEKMKV